MHPDLVVDIEVERAQNRSYVLADGLKITAAKSNALALYLRYAAQAERQYRRAVEEFDRLKALRGAPQPLDETNPIPPEESQTEAVTAVLTPALSVEPPRGAAFPGGDARIPAGILLLPLSSPISPLTSNPIIATICSVTMFSARNTRKALSELEHMMMGVLWERPSATAEDVRVALAERHPMKESTVRTILKRLEGKATRSIAWKGARTSIRASMRRKM